MFPFNLILQIFAYDKIIAIKKFILSRLTLYFLVSEFSSKTPVIMQIIQYESMTIN